MIHILGAGGFGREVLNIFVDLGRGQDIAGFIEEDCECPGRTVNGITVQDVTVLKDLNRDSVQLVCAIGTPLRKRLIENLKDSGFSFETVVHPSVTSSRWVQLGKGVIICAGSILTSQIDVGDHVIVNLACTIGHDVTIGRFTTISPGAHISGRVSIGDECFIGTGVSIVDRVRIGNRVYIGAGAVITRDIPDGVLAVGVPAKPIRILDDDQWHRLV
jgi:sugar O-acyltransferase (sialic acid O-acetyltransferase NeuD family)